MSYWEPLERGGCRLAPHGLGRQQHLLLVIFLLISLKIINNENEKKCEIIKIHKDSFKNILTE